MVTRPEAAFADHARPGTQVLVILASTIFCFFLFVSAPLNSTGSLRRVGNRMLTTAYLEVGPLQELVMHSASGKRPTLQIAQEPILILALRIHAMSTVRAALYLADQLTHRWIVHAVHADLDFWLSVQNVSMCNCEISPKRILESIIWNHLAV